MKRQALCLVAFCVLFCALWAADRSPKWPAVRAKHVAEHPTCIVCGKPVTQVHHVKPFHLHPELELDPANLVSLDDDCHLRIGHLGNFKNENPDVRLHARILLFAKRNADAVRNGQPPEEPTIRFHEKDEMIVMSFKLGTSITDVEVSHVVEQLNAIAGGIEVSK